MTGQAANAAPHKEKAPCRTRSRYSRRLARDCVACFALVAGLVLFTAAFARCQTAHPEPGLAPTPPMGWANWNHFFCDYDDQTVREQADALVATGMRDIGYKYVLIQECIAPRRDASGELVVDPVRFPHGMEEPRELRSLACIQGRYLHRYWAVHLFFQSSLSRQLRTRRPGREDIRGVGHGFCPDGLLQSRARAHWARGL